MRPFVIKRNNIPNLYMLERFNALAERGNIDFEAWFNKRREHRGILDAGLLFGIGLYWGQFFYFG